MEEKHIESYSMHKELLFEDFLGHGDFFLKNSTEVQKNMLALFPGYLLISKSREHTGLYSSQVQHGATIIYSKATNLFT